MPTPKMNRCAMALLCLSAMFVIGCKGSKDQTPTGEVEGTVTLDGKPLTDGSVAFYNVETGATAGATLGEGGKFKMDAPVAVGTYQVSFLPPPPPQPDDEASGKKATELSRQIPIDYQTGGTSGIVAKVVEGSNSFKFELKKSGPPKTPGDQTPP